MTAPVVSKQQKAAQAWIKIRAQTRRRRRRQAHQARQEVRLINPYIDVLARKGRKPEAAEPPSQILACPQCPRIPCGRHWPGLG